MITNLFSSLPMVLSVFWILMLLLEAKKSVAKRILLIFFSFVFINYTIHWFYFSEAYELFSFFDHLWVFVSLSIFPIVYIYIRTLTVDTKFEFKWLALLIIPFLLSLYSYIVYFNMTSVEKSMFLDSVMYRKTPLPDEVPLTITLLELRLLIFKIIYPIQAAIILFFSLRLLREYNQKIDEFYSNVGGKKLQNVNSLLWLLIFTVILSSAFGIVGKEVFAEHSAYLNAASFIHSSFLFAVGYVTYHQNFTIVDFQKDIGVSEIINEKEKLEEEENLKEGSKLSRELLRLLKEEEIFKDPNLKITDVAQLLNTNRTYVSKVINEEFETHFSDLINDFRIDNAKDLLACVDCKEKTLSEIAEISGFSSDSTFYRVFKNKVKVSPGVYRDGTF